MFNQYGYQPNGSNYHDHLCRCPACDVQEPSWLRELYRPLSSNSYYEPDEAAPIWQSVDEEEIEDLIENEPPTESEMDAMFSAYHQPPTYQLTAENFTLVVLMEDAIEHDDEHPFCFDQSCGCHTDPDLLREYCAKPIERGHLTDREARRLWLSEVL